MINWGVIGFGRMGKTFAGCFEKPNANYHLKGIASKSNLKVIDTDKTFKRYENYNDLINSPEIDAIYISTLNNTHKDLVLKSIKQNKKVLCEKPLGMNCNEVKEINNLIKEKKNSFFEAIAYRSHPQTLKLLEILDNKNFGKIKRIEANFGFRVKRIKKDSRLFDKSLGGGSILDLGCYPISFFNLFVDKSNDIEIQKSNYSLCETDVDIDGEIHLRLNNDINAISKISLSQDLENVCRLYFENAVITVPFPWLPPKKSFLEVETKSRYFKEFVITDKDIYKHQLEKVTSHFNDESFGDSYLVDIKESLIISSILDTWLK